MSPLIKVAGALVHPHGDPRTLREVQYFQEHEHRGASAEYDRVRDHVINVLDEPCWVCGIRKSTGGKMEAHHDELEWALANSVDPAKLLADFPSIGVADDAHLRAWLDSEHNLLVLCEDHHRHAFFGIHMVSYPPWKAQRWARLGTPVLIDPTKEHAA